MDHIWICFKKYDTHPSTHLPLTKLIFITVDVVWNRVREEKQFMCLNIIPVTIHICSLPFKIVVVSQTHRMCNDDWFFPQVKFAASVGSFHSSSYIAFLCIHIQEALSFCGLWTTFFLRNTEHYGRVGEWAETQWSTENGEDPVFLHLLSQLCHVSGGNLLYYEFSRAS